MRRRRRQGQGRAGRQAVVQQQGAGSRQQQEEADRRAERHHSTDRPTDQPVNISSSSSRHGAAAAPGAGDVDTATAAFIIITISNQAIHPYMMHVYGPTTHPPTAAEAGSGGQQQGVKEEEEQGWMSGQVVPSPFPALSLSVCLSWRWPPPSSYLASRGLLPGPSACLPSLPTPPILKLLLSYKVTARSLERWSR